MNEQHYQRIARYLDGENITLQPDERAVVEEIRRSDALLGEKLNVAFPNEVLSRILRRRHAETLHPSRRTLRFTLTAASVAAAAAMVLLAVSLFLRPAPPTDSTYVLRNKPQVPRPGANVPMAEMIDSLQAVSAFDHELDQLAEEFDREGFGVAGAPDLVGETGELLDGRQENTRQSRDENFWNVPDKRESADPLEAY
ncbi:MAG: hypothetical protein JXA11_12295 [Phycisphaerae bacterium]|nr:hypothetical protein [Phycisphaerae bacterium]